MNITLLCVKSNYYLLKPNILENIRAFGEIIVENYHTLCENSNEFYKISATIGVPFKRGRANLLQRLTLTHRGKSSQSPANLDYDRSVSFAFPAHGLKVTSVSSYYRTGRHSAIESEAFFLVRSRLSKNF